MIPCGHRHSEDHCRNATFTTWLPPCAQWVLLRGEGCPGSCGWGNPQKGRLCWNTTRCYCGGCLQSSAFGSLLSELVYYWILEPKYINFCNEQSGRTEVELIFPFHRCRAVCWWLLLLGYAEGTYLQNSLSWFCLYSPSSPPPAFWCWGIPKQSLLLSQSVGALFSLPCQIWDHLCNEFSDDKTWTCNITNKLMRCQLESSYIKSLSFSLWWVWLSVLRKENK